MSSHAEQQCSWCGRWVGPDNMDDGLRCKFCQEQDARIVCCPSAIATGGAYHAPECALGPGE